MVLEQLVTELSLNNPLAQSVVIGGFRSLLGFAENAIGAVQGKNGLPTWSWSMFISTMARIVPQVLALSFAGLPPEVALGTDWGIGKIAKIRKG